MDQDEQTLQTIINQYRHDHNLSNLPISATLTRAAQWMANDMASSGDINSHTDSLGRQDPQRNGDCGYPSPTTSSGIIASSGPVPPQLVLQSWENSPDHNVVLLNQIMSTSGGTLPRNWQAMGVGKSTSGTGSLGWKWVVTFGEVNDGGVVPTVAAATPTPTPTIAIQPTPTPTPIGASPTATPALTGTPTPTATLAPALSPTPAQTQISVSVKLPGVGINTAAGENPNPKPTLNGQVALTGAVSNETSTVAVIFNYNSTNGTYNIVLPVGAGTYLVKARTINSLWENLGLVEVASGQTASPQTLQIVTGDISSTDGTQDNTLDLSDYNALLFCYGLGNCGQKAAADLNLDGTVDAKDMNIFYVGLARRQGD